MIYLPSYTLFVISQPYYVAIRLRWVLDRLSEYRTRLEIAR